MKYKILVPNANGEFTFTKEELEKFMEEIYDEGYNDGRKYTITTPVYPRNPIITPTITWSDKTTPINTTTAYWSGTDPAAIECTTTNPAIRNDPFTLTGDTNGK